MQVLVVLLTIFAVYQILLHFGVFEFSKGFASSVDEVKRKRKVNKKRRFEKAKLNMYYSLTDSLRGILMTDYAKNLHQYQIERLDIRSEILDRQLKPEELRGKYASLLILGILVIPLGFFYKVVWVFTAYCVFRFATYNFVLGQKIDDEDKIIDDYFLDLYLLMYSKLRLGSKARLQTVVESYINTLETAQNIQMKNTMLKLSEYLLNNLSMYEDHVAVPKLRDRYRSATIVNFCNVASQALQGIDNADNLLTFKVSLVRRKTLMMENRAKKLCLMGERSIFAIYLILIIFVLSGIYSKLPTGVF